MWGGWYNDEVIMNEMAKYRQIYADSINKAVRQSKAELAVFIDESNYYHLASDRLRNAPFNQRHALGLAGMPYDLYDISDFKAVYKKYKAVIFISGLKTDHLKSAVSLCRAGKIAYLLTSHQKATFTAKEIQRFCKANGVHVYCDSQDIVYVNNNYIAVHACSDGKKELTFTDEVTLTDLLDSGAAVKGKTVEIEMKHGETKLFEIMR